MDTFATLLVTLELIVLLIIWVGLPLVPAIMIYRYFPETQVFPIGRAEGQNKRGIRRLFDRISLHTSAGQHDKGRHRQRDAAVLGNSRKGEAR